MPLAHRTKCVFTRSPVGMPVYVSACLFACRSVCLSACLSCLYICDTHLCIQSLQLDLSNKNLEQLPSKLWDLPLHELDLSNNPRLGRVLLPALKAAARCPLLKLLRLRDVVTEGGVCGWGRDVVWCCRYVGLRCNLVVSICVHGVGGVMRCVGPMFLRLAVKVTQKRASWRVAYS